MREEHAKIVELEKELKEMKDTVDAVNHTNGLLRGQIKDLIAEQERDYDPRDLSMLKPM